MRLIDADAQKARLRGCVILMPNGEKCMADRAIDTERTIEAEPVKYGQWSDNGEDKYICSVCRGYVYRWFGKSDFCPRCGAKMQDGGAENG